METVLFVFTRLLTALASPLCLFLILLLILSLRVLRSMERPRLRSAFLALWFLGFVFSLPLLSNALVGLWESPRSPAPSGHWDAIVVLGGAVDPAASAGWQVELNDSAERVVTAARLYHEGRAPWIIVSGGSGDLHFPDAREAPLLKQLLVGMGVPAAAIVVEAESRNTFENAAAVHALVVKNGLKHIVLVTSALHMPRAQAIFVKAGFAASDGKSLSMEVFSVDSLRRPNVLPEALIPNASAVVTNARVLREMVGFVVYRILDRL